MPMEFSTETNCGPDSWLSCSVRPRHGRMMASFPTTRWDRFSLVEIWTVRSQFLEPRPYNQCLVLLKENSRPWPGIHERDLHASHGSRPTVSRPDARGAENANAVRGHPEKRLRVRSDTDGTISLNIAVSADRTGACAWFTNAAFHKQQVHTGLDY